MNAKIDISNVVLRTERLIPRPWRMEDLADFYEYASVDGVGQMAAGRPMRAWSGAVKDTWLSVLER